MLCLYYILPCPTRCFVLRPALSILHPALSYALPCPVLRLSYALPCLTFVLRPLSYVCLTPCSFLRPIQKLILHGTDLRTP